MSDYPGSIDSFDTLVGSDTVDGDIFSERQEAIVAIETELGTDPAGAYSTVKDRLNAIDTMARAVAVYETNTAQVFSEATKEIINFEDKVNDPDSLVTTGASWKFTAEKSGYHLVTCMVQMESVDWSVDDELWIYLHKNGVEAGLVAFAEGYGRGSSDNFYLTAHGSDIVDLAEGDYIDLRLYYTFAGDANDKDLSGDANYNHVAIAYLVNNASGT